jgi:hypothetical protein
MTKAQMHINKDEKESLIYLANSLINDLEMFKSEKFMLEPK